RAAATAGRDVPRDPHRRRAGPVPGEREAGLDLRRLRRRCRRTHAGRRPAGRWDVRGETGQEKN
ncbi:MAG TPA: hypothetical protein VIU63_01950, partial [Nitrospira sp.]